MSKAWRPAWAVEAEQRNLSWAESKALYMKNFYAEQRGRAAEARNAEKRSMPRVPHTETIAEKAQRQARERYLKLQGKRFDPYIDQG